MQIQAHRGCWHLHPWLGGSETSFVPPLWQISSWRSSWESRSQDSHRSRTILEVSTLKATWQDYAQPLTFTMWHREGTGCFNQKRTPAPKKFPENLSLASFSPLGQKPWVCWMPGMEIYFWTNWSWSHFLAMKEVWKLVGQKCYNGIEHQRMEVTIRFVG